MALRDRTIALVRHGYLFSDMLDKETRRPGSATPIRLLGRRSLVLRGPEGVELFYDEDRVVRRRALPAVVAHSLFGKGAVNGLDGAEHRHRKQLFLDVTSAGPRGRPRGSGRREVAGRAGPMDPQSPWHGAPVRGARDR